MWESYIETCLFFCISFTWERTVTKTWSAWGEENRGAGSLSPLALLRRSCKQCCPLVFLRDECRAQKIPFNSMSSPPKGPGSLQKQIEGSQKHTHLLHGYFKISRGGRRETSFRDKGNKWIWSYWPQCQSKVQNNVFLKTRQLIFFPKEHKV